ncbi:MAG: NAD(P)H-dependent oxidoreductase [Flavobacteriaceae bacterium CG_4_8_14_3_um_filter_34_10]|nr:NAD(P)H-dependent oxidoreductase [Flavobacteriia bacterium]OIP52465.1 MAG: NAD(P)H-dependent oxidoreductase [Flavobacteriaceae bacterium CG2_30_34_30]PIQ18282.1 MAG: NAD(P)H-dependent oxidoreductase [Flavobacteriaceae bacterium CG18_big_fil_WC_8_21_14_2_50_34_36]PIV48822.1 MAG: NAD(P)H-dependent oxidoreductase [Flavobacteriaceae bacterium CG02_land_8_20_14_3_00_34_13]PIX08993.1 MAG: NAD(P)H-dependent oxidoreductase [Flavobacteriaceae bacterium CG_4_8_14_3_um_filter_34_10]PIZ07236.1 MAG: NAD
MSKNSIKALQWRYATKNFDVSKIISEGKISILKEAFNLTASSYGLQPVKLLVVSNAKIKKELPPMTMNQNQVKDASHVLIFCIEETISSEFVAKYFNLVASVRNTSEEILEPFKNILMEDFKKKPLNDIQNWATNQAYLAMGNLLTVCALEEIDSCPIEGFSPMEYDIYFNLKEKGLRSVLVLAIGYRAKDDFFAAFKKVRKGVEECVIEIK